jgi:hypothetical protein
LLVGKTTLMNARSAVCPRLVWTVSYRIYEWSEPNPVTGLGGYVAAGRIQTFETF